jgi:serine/threonine protein kinase
MTTVTLLLLSLSVFIANLQTSNGEVAVIPISENVNQVVIYNGGEVVGEFKLEQRLDYLGAKTLFRDYDQRMLLGSTANQRTGNMAFDIEQSVSFGYLTLLNEIRIDMNASCIRNGTYCLDVHIFRGGHGEVWRGRKISREGLVDKNRSYILKRMHIDDRPDILRCVLREIYFGSKLKGVSDVARYVSYFATVTDYWLVFMDEGVSLEKLLYAVTISDVSALLEPSQLWKKLRTPSGASSMRGIMQQIITSVAALHFRGITHRDIKPSNILLNTEAEARILMADFSSAVSDEALGQGLYGDLGPLTDEETLQYAPPEVVLFASTESEIPFDSQYPMSYDIWSVGVVFLEMILGTSDVFTVDQRTGAMIAHRMRKLDVSSKEITDAMLLAAFADYCIYHREDGTDEDKDSEVISEDMSTESDFINSVGEFKLNDGKEEECELLSTDVMDGEEEGLITIGSELPSTGKKNRVSRINYPSNNRKQSRKKMGAHSSHQRLHPMINQVHECGLEELRQAILRRDPLGTGFTDRYVYGNLKAANHSGQIYNNDISSCYLCIVYRCILYIISGNNTWTFFK